MAKYSIKDLENFTKIKAHTLRIWEQRYQLLTPERTDTNIRFYSDRDLKKILNINLLYNHGLKISKIANLSEEEIFEKASEILRQDQSSNQDLVNKFALLKELALEHGVEKLFSDILIPLLEKIGVLWQVDAISVSHEHFISNILREFLIVQIDGLPPNRLEKGRVVLFLREGEKHELSLLFYYYVLKKRGYDCFYLGQSVPMRDLQTFVAEIQPDYLFTSLIAEITQKDFKKFIDQLAAFFDLKNLFMGGIQLLNNQQFIPKEARQIQKLSDIRM